jgi:hypothetical protein
MHPLVVGQGRLKVGVRKHNDQFYLAIPVMRIKVDFWLGSVSTTNEGMNF